MSAIKNLSVLFTVVVSLVVIGNLTKDNYMDIHNGARPVIEYNADARVIDTANLIVQANTF